MSRLNNPYKFFRGVRDKVDLPQLSYLSKRYDEPTYLTFRVFFGQNSETWSGVTLLNTNYDRMPHPLFINRTVDAERRETPDSERGAVDINREVYSTRDFLRDSNEFTRAAMLDEFITVWRDLQNNFQWYFQSIEGLDELLRTDTTKGRRVLSENTLTFNMLEGIDQRVTYLLTLYRKIAWDDTYQRWVLPDMMRFFDIDIYVTEFRTFHQSMAVGASDEPVYLRVLNGILPTHLIQLHMCEFDINSFEFSNRSRLNVSDDPEQQTVSFKVKVGNLNEVLSYPLFAHYNFDDYRLNGADRSREFGLVKDRDGRIVNSLGPMNFPVMDEYVSTKSGDPRYKDLDLLAQDIHSQDPEHISGQPYHQQNLRENVWMPTIYKDFSEIDPTQPSTWVGNAITWGKAFGVNFFTSTVNKAKMTKIPILGFSFNEAVASIESKDFTSVLGLIRRSIAEAQRGTQPPSSMLEEKIDSMFREVLIGLSQSEATDGDELELSKTATKVLNNRGEWERVKDLSYATNMVGPGEFNIPVTIEGGMEYKRAIRQQTQGDRSFATDLDGGPSFVQPPGFTGGGTPATDPGNVIDDYDQGDFADIKIIQPGYVMDSAPSGMIGGKITPRGPTTDTLSRSTVSPVKDAGDITGGGGIGRETDDQYTPNVRPSRATQPTNVQSGALKGKGELGKSITSGYGSDDAPLSSSTDKTLQKISLKGDGGLGENIKGGMADTRPTDSTASDGAIDPIEMTGKGGLSDTAIGGLEATEEKSRATDKRIKEATFHGEGGLGGRIDDDLEQIDTISKATENDIIDQNVQTVSPSKATDNKEIKG